MIIKKNYSLSSVLEAVYHPVLVLDHRGLIVYANSSFTRFSGYEFSELRTHSLSFFVNDVDQEYLEDVIKDFNPDEVVKLSCSFRQKQEGDIIIEFEYKAIVEGETTSYVVSVLEKPKEQELGDFYKQKFNLATKLAVIGVWEMDINTRAITWSGEIYSLFEMSKKAKATPLNQLEIFSERDRVFLKQHLEKLLDKGAGYKLELQITLAEGKKKWVRCIGKSEIDKDGELKVYGSVQDITKVVNERLKLQQLTNDLSRQKLQMEQFNQIVSHNLRSPIANIGLLLKYYEESEDTEERQQYIKYLKQSSDGLHQMLEDLVDAVKILNTNEISTERVNIKSLFEKVRGTLTADIVASNATVTLDDEGWKQIDYSTIYLESILMNLISNAIKYAKKGVAPKIEIITRKEGKQYILEVKDNGMGIDLEQNGELVFKLHKAINKDNAGKGLGLFMTKQQVEAMGGVISVNSKLGEGSSFVMNLLKYRM